MKLRRFLRILFGLLVVLVVAVGLISINHPIILKWVTGSAKHHGKPMPATVFTNGQLNDSISVFYIDEKNNYLISFAKYDNIGRLKILNINLDEKWIGTPVATSKNNYDLIAGHLFQSKTSGHFTPFQDYEKGFNFDPQLTYAGRQIKFNMPPNILNIDSVRIILP